MVFTTFKFLVFLCLVVVCYFVCPVRHRWKILLAASIIFYYTAGMKYLPFIMTTIIASYLAALYISNQRSRPNTYKKVCKRVLMTFFLVALGILCYTKFANKILGAVSHIFSLLRPEFSGFSAINIIIPLGISYYTFSTIGYVLDVYWKRYDAERDFFKYMLYVMYFPHILQGPIARYNKLAPQLYAEHRFDYKRVCFGAQLMLWGFFQKLVIADRLAIFVNTVYGDWQLQEGFILLIATVFASIQIYTDFAGYINIAKGISQIFGIELEDNFCQPYFAQSVAEFWRRWHITLGAWFKDYLCMPIAVSGSVKKWSKQAKRKRGGQAGKNVVTIVPLIAVWLATGLWHGTGWNYIIWGIWHGGIIICSTLLEKKYIEWKQKLHIDDKTRGWKLLCMARTFVLTAIIPRVITRAGSLMAAVGIFQNMFSKFNVWVFVDKSLYDYGLDAKDFGVIISSLLVLLVVSLMKEKGIHIRETIAKRNIALRWMVYYLAFFSVVILGIYGSGYDKADFIYMMF
ncbi:MAG: MBOAT family O-acyltransferase [Suilimivivens sp.]